MRGGYSAWQPSTRTCGAPIDADDVSPEYATHSAGHARCPRSVVPDETDSDYVAFSSVVAEGYDESGIDGIHIYHNSNALGPLDPDLLPGAAHHFLISGELLSRIPPGHLTASVTTIIIPTTE
jgi:hypothetical protein